MTVRRPLGELDLRDELRLQPTALFHLIRRQRPHRPPFLRQVGERTLLSCEAGELFENFTANVRDETGSDLGDELQRGAFIATDDQRSALQFSKDQRN